MLEKEISESYQVSFKERAVQDFLYISLCFQFGELVGGLRRYSVKFVS